MSVLGIDQITYAADDLAVCRSFFQDWGLVLKSEAADELVFECLNGCKVVVAALDKPGLPAPLQKTNAIAALKSAGEAPAAGTNAPNAHPDTNIAEDAAGGAPTAAETVVADETLDEFAWRRKAELEETEHILADYLSLLPKDHSVLVAH